VKLQVGECVQKYGVGLSYRFLLYAVLPLADGIQGTTMLSIEGHSIDRIVTEVALVISWIFVQVAFGLYYAREYYSPKAKSSNGGFEFANNSLPHFWDFIHFAFVIGMRIQTPRVPVTSKKMRRAVIVHCIMSMILNTAILLWAILIVAGT
jgi:uncharacterized membrane protein